MTHSQILFLQYVRDGGERRGKPHGLIQRGYLTHVWGAKPDYGYKLTPAGARALLIAETTK